MKGIARGPEPTPGAAPAGRMLPGGLEPRPGATRQHDGSRRVREVRQSKRTASLRRQSGPGHPSRQLARGTGRQGLRAGPGVIRAGRILPGGLEPRPGPTSPRPVSRIIAAHTTATSAVGRSIALGTGRYGPGPAFAGNVGPLQGGPGVDPRTGAVGTRAKDWPTGPGREPPDNLSSNPCIRWHAHSGLARWPGPAPDWNQSADGRAETRAQSVTQVSTARQPPCRQSVRPDQVAET